MKCRRSSYRSMLRALLVPVTLHAATAQAGPVEELAQLAFDPDDPCHVGLRYEYGQGGVLISHDGGRTFRLRCSSSFDEAGAFDDDLFTFGFGAEGAPLVGSFAGLAFGDAQACGFTKKVDPLVDARVTSFAHHPSDSSTTYLSVASASAGERTGIVARSEDGTLRAFGADDTSAAGVSRFFANKLVPAPRRESAGGVRWYESGGLRLDDDSLVPALRYSDDGAQTWTEHELPEASAAAEVRLWAVDPNDPDRIVFSFRDYTGTGSDDVVWVSSDAGENRQEWIGGASSDVRVAEVAAVVVQPDGRVWVADAGSEVSPGGLLRASSLLDPPEALHRTAVRCLGLRQQDGTLFGCGAGSFGPVDTDTGEVIPVFTLAHTEGFVQCADEALATRCESQLCAEYCGPLHNAAAPLCRAYDRPACGPDADAAIGGSRVPEITHVVDALCPHPEDDTVDAAAAQDGGATADASAPEDDSARPDTPPAPSPAEGSGSGGCRLASDAGTTAAWLPLLLVALVRRRLRAAIR